MKILKGIVSVALFFDLTGCQSRSQIDANFLSTANLGQTDDATNMFAGGSAKGTTWDSSQSFLRLDQSGLATDLALASSWTPAWSNVIGYWKLDDGVGSPTAADSSGMGNNGNATTVTLGTAGEVGTAATCAATSIPIQTTINLTGDFTISAWANLSGAIGSNQILVGNAVNSDDLNFTGGKLRLFGSATNIAISSTSTTAGVWHQYVITRSGNAAGNIKIYMDGSLVSTGTWLSTTFVIDRIGGSSFAANSMTGTLDDVAIWNTALSPSAVVSIYQHETTKYAGTYTSRTMDSHSSLANWTNLTWISTLPFFKELPDGGSSESHVSYSSQSDSLMTGIQGLWHFDESAWNGTINEVVDSSGNLRHGTRAGSATTSQNGKLSGAGKFNGATFDGVNLGANTLSGLTGDFTISAWVNPSTLSGNQAIYSTSGARLKFSSNNGNLQIQAYDGGAFRFITSVSSVVANQWSHVVVTKSAASGVFFYINGVQDAQTMAGNFTTAYFAGITSLGAGLANSSFYFYGLIDEIGIWNRGLSQSEVLELYRRGVNRIRFQIRTCATTNVLLSDCTDGSVWRGPGSNDQFYFSESYNTLANALGAAVQAGLPSMLFANFGSLTIPTNRYFQYRAIMESDDAGTSCNYGSGPTWCSPEIQSVTAGPPH